MTKSKRLSRGTYWRRRARTRSRRYDRRVVAAVKSVFTPPTSSTARVDARVLFHHACFLLIVCMCASRAMTCLKTADWNGLTITALVGAGPVVAVSLLQHSPIESDDTTVWHEALDRSGALLLMWLAFIGLGLASELEDGPDLSDVPGGDALIGLLTILGLYYMLTDLRAGFHAATFQRLRHRGLWQRSKDGFFAIVLAVMFALLGLLANASDSKPTPSEPDMYCYPTDTAAVECFEDEQRKGRVPPSNGGGAERPATGLPEVSL